MARLRMLGVVGCGLCIAACGQLLGLNDYKVASDDGGTGGGAGSDGSGGTGGGGTGGGGTGGEAGSGANCEADNDCDTRNDCSIGSCEDGTCVYAVAALGSSCGDAGVCNGDENDPACVTCIDDAEGTDVDSGCTDGAPECQVNDDGEAICMGCGSDSDCDDDNDCTEDTCDGGSCSNDALNAGEACGSGVCNGNATGPACVTCIDDASGLDQDTGCDADAPTCVTNGTPECIQCFDDEDCDDGNPCTDQDCISSFCEYATLDAGEACGDGVSGLCNGESIDDACGACIDDAADDEVDSGCTTGAPICDTTTTPYRCTGCIDNSDCDDGISCTVDTCTSGGVCSNAPDNSLCEGTGTECDPMTCTGANTSDGCEVTDGRHYKSLLINGDFETVGGWIEDASDGAYIIVEDPYYTYSGYWYAWLGGTLDSTHAIYQVFDVPPNALELGVEFYYWIATQETGTAKDFGTVEFRDEYAADGSDFYTFLSWASVDDETGGWEQVSDTYDASSIAGDSISLYFESVQSPESSEDVGNTNFFVDLVSVTAMCCGDPCE